MESKKGGDFMRVKRLIALFLSLSVLFGVFIITVSATMQNTGEPKTSFIRSIDASINVGVLNTTVTGQVRGTSSVTSIKIKLELQKKTGTTYSTIKTWEEIFYSDEATKTESKLTSPLNTYRLKATFTVYTSTSSETKVVYAVDD